MDRKKKATRKSFTGLILEFTFLAWCVRYHGTWVSLVERLLLLLGYSRFSLAYWEVGYREQFNISFALSSFCMLVRLRNLCIYLG